MATRSRTAQTRVIDDESFDQRTHVRDESDQLRDEYLLLRQKANRLGELLCEMGCALRHRPESIVVMPTRGAVIDDAAIVLTEHPPTLLAIERIATDIRTIQQRLSQLQQARPEGPTSASAA